MEMLKTGTLTCEVHEGGRRWGGTRVTLRCDALAYSDRTILLLSVVGPESSIKSVRACLQSGPDARVQFSAEMDGRHSYNLQPFDKRYRCQAHQILPGLWHLVAIAKLPGFMPVMNDEALWLDLQSDRWTTPILRQWMPWIKGRMLDQGMMVTLTQFGCEAGLIIGTSEQMDWIVSDGIMSGKLQVPGASGARSGAEPANLDEYMERYGSLLGKQAERSLVPLHVPGRDKLQMPTLLRQPFESQAHVIMATVKAMRRQKSVEIIGEMGTGKTIMGMAAIHAHANGRPYRGLVFCPGQLTKKWERELLETLPGITVHQIESWKDLLTLDRQAMPTGPEWYIIARDRAKLGSRWAPSYVRKRQQAKDGQVREFVACPTCGHFVTDDEGTLIERSALGVKRTFCEHARKPVSQGMELTAGCGAALWQMTGELWRYEPALYIKRRLHRFFDYLVLDEIHEEKSSTSAQANAAGSLVAACKKVVALTGTLIGGYAEHVRPLLFRLSPQSLVDEGLTWSNALPFSERYGRIDTTIMEKSGGRDRSDDNRESRGSSNGRSVRRSVRPGIMPALFGRHLIDKAVFLSLSEVADNLPALDEELIAVPMDAEQAAEYRRIEDELTAAMKPMLAKGDRRLLGKMLQTLLAYPDHPYGWGAVGYGDGDHFTVVNEPADLDESIRPKEQALIDLCVKEKAANRQVWVYVQYTDAHDVQGRLEKLLKGAGLSVGVLRSSVSLAKREEWIAKNGPKLDVVVSHPKLVETGLDLFDKGGRHNFSTLVFYETGYNLFTLRQASRRSWRIGQQLPCKVVYLFYEQTMQARAMALMGKKLAASQALEGKFSTEGLVAMGGEEGSVEVALARSLVDRMDLADVRRTWAKIGGKTEPKHEPEPPKPGKPQLDGHTVLDLMRKNKVTIKALSERLGVSEYQVRKARTNGVGASDSERWMQAIVGPKMSRRTAHARPRTTRRRAA